MENEEKRGKLERVKTAKQWLCTRHCADKFRQILTITPGRHFCVVRYMKPNAKEVKLLAKRHSC